MIAPTDWAAAVLAASPRPIPAYGSEQWAALPAHDPRILAAVVVYAECWRAHCHPRVVEEEVAAGLDADDACVHARLGDAAADVRVGLDFDLLASPTHAEMLARRREVH